MKNDYGPQESLAETLWQSLCRSPQFEASPGVRGIFRRLVHIPLVKAHYRSIHRHGHGAPWLYFRYLASKMVGAPFSVEANRWEPLEWSIDHSTGYELVRSGSFRQPMLLGVGYPRSGTTTLQNALLYGFRSHVIPGQFNRPRSHGEASPLAIWWQVKHDATALSASSTLPNSVVRNLVVVRPFESAAAALWNERGPDHNFELDAEYEQWREMATTAISGGNTLPISFEVIKAMEPHSLISYISKRLEIEPDRVPDPTASWQIIYETTGMGEVRGIGHNLPDRQASKARPMYAALIQERMTDNIRQESRHLYQRVANYS